MLRFATALLVGALTIGGDAAKPLDWMLGQWRSGPAWGVGTFEQWDRGADGSMIGVSQDYIYDQSGDTEKVSIAVVGDKFVYFASVNGAPEVAFTETTRGSAGIIFENRDHGYPQRIRYWRDGDELWAEVSLADGRMARRWRYSRAASAPAR